MHIYKPHPKLKEIIDFYTKLKETKNKMQLFPGKKKLLLQICRLNYYKNIKIQIMHSSNFDLLIYHQLFTKFHVLEVSVPSIQL